MHILRIVPMIDSWKGIYLDKKICILRLWIHIFQTSSHFYYLLKHMFYHFYTPINHVCMREPFFPIKSSLGTVFNLCLFCIILSLLQVWHFTHMGFGVWAGFKSQLHQLPVVILGVNYISAPTLNSRRTNHSCLPGIKGYPGIIDFKC